MLSVTSRRGGRGAPCFLLGLLLAVCMAWPAVVAAQATGGSFGGGSFSTPSSDHSGGGGGGGGRRDEDTWPPARTSSFPRSDPPPSPPSTPWPPRREAQDAWSSDAERPHADDVNGSRPAGEGMGAAFWVLIAILGVGFFLDRVFGVRSLDVDESSRSPVANLVDQPLIDVEALATSMDVAGIVLAIDWHARREVQAKLAKLARKGDTSSPEGLARLAHATALTLKDAEVSWLYGAALSTPPVAASEAERLFRATSADVRGRFRHELIRNADGSTRVTAAPEQRASREEGEGVVVVTLLVAARRRLTDVTNGADAVQLHQVLDQVMGLDARTIAVLEVIWSPAEENDRMSTAELEVLYPELRRLDERSVVGRHFCAHCAAPFARELRRCPHCGAPVDAAPSERTSNTL